MSKKPQYSNQIELVSPAYLAETREEFTGIEYLPKVVYKNASRYKNLRTIQDKETGKIFHESWYQNFIPKTSDDNYFTVTKFEEGRLDIIALSYYGTSNYWWVIAMANYIIDPFDVPVGTVLRIPPIISLYKAGGVLSG